MAFELKRYTNRQVEHPNRRRLVPVQGSSNTYDAYREEGMLFDDGVPYNADTMNDLEGRVKKAFDQSKSDLDAAISQSDTTLRGLINQRAPTNHASIQTTYGKGTPAYYGHLKISDSYTSSAGDVNEGVAASSYALNAAYTSLNNNKAPTNHATSGTTYGAGNGTQYGHLRLSNSTNSNRGEDNGYAATPLAVYNANKNANDAYDRADAAYSKIQAAEKNLSNFFTTYLSTTYSAAGSTLQITLIGNLVLMYLKTANVSATSITFSVPQTMHPSQSFGSLEYKSVYTVGDGYIATCTYSTTSSSIQFSISHTKIPGGSGGTGIDRGVSIHIIAPAKYNILGQSVSG